MVIEEQLSDFSINLNELLPVERSFRGQVVLNRFEFIREPPSQHKLVSPVFVEASNFFYYDSFVIFENSDPLHQTIHLLALCVSVHLAFFVEDGLLPLGAKFCELVPAHEQSWAPWRRHVQGLLVLVGLVVLFVFIVVDLVQVFLAA